MFSKRVYGKSQINMADWSQPETAIKQRIKQMNFKASLMLVITLVVFAGLNLSCDNQEKRSGKPMTEIDGLTMSEVGNVWKFKTDPDDVGLKEKWYASQIDDSGWAEVRNDLDSGWESQAFPGYTGYGWYRQQVKVPPDMDKQKSFYLCFGGVDEDAEIYINGVKAFEHTCASTGLIPNEIWITPFAFDPRPWLKAGRENLIAVRVYNSAGMGGIWKPVYFITGDTEVTAGRIAELVEEKVRPSDAKELVRGYSEVPEGVLDTGVMGGVDCPTAEELAAMQKGQYILHARAGKITRVPVEKSRLPHDPKGHNQFMWTAMGPDGVVYVNQGSIMCKSTDGGKTWTSHDRPHGAYVWDMEQVGKKWGPLGILNDGKFISVWVDKYNEPGEVMLSDDEGRSWKKISEFSTKIPGYTFVGSGPPMYRLPDDTLLWFGTWDRGDIASGTWDLMTYVCRSEDGGITWSSPSEYHECAFEGGITQLPSGRLLAVVRYQRPWRTDDPPNLLEKTEPGPWQWLYKHVFLLDSDDGGRSWTNFRQLTTTFGQCYGYPAALSDGTVVVIHDTRYGPGVQSGRAMISRDEGKTWQDEVYYTYYGKAVSGYSQSVVLKDGVILTIAGTSDYGPATSTWAEAVGRSDLTAIRWKPVKE